MVNNQIAELHNKYCFEIKKLKQFLIANNAYFNYLENIYKLKNIKNYYDFLERIEALHKCILVKYEYQSFAVLIRGFPWSSSKEGYYFWSELYDKALKTKDIMC